MNAQLPSKSEPTAAKPLMPTISPGLKSLLSYEPSNARAVSEIARTPALRAEAERLLPALKAEAMNPAGEEGVYRVIASRRPLFPQPERTAAESAAWWAAYYDALAGLPEGAIETAMQAWVKLPDAEFMPKPGKLLELARMTPNRAVRAYDRARQAVEFSEPVARESVGPAAMAEILAPIGRKPVEKTPAEKAAVKAAMRRFIEQDDARREREAVSRRVSGLEVQLPPVENGITPQMRALLGFDHDNVTQRPS